MARVLGYPVGTVLRIYIATNTKICFIRHENVVKDVVIQSVKQKLTKSLSIYNLLVIHCLNHNQFVRMEI